MSSTTADSAANTAAAANAAAIPELAELAANLTARTSGAPIAKTFHEARIFSRVVGGQRKRPQPISADYIHIAVHEDFTKERFNGVENLVTQSVEVTGVNLVWDELDRSTSLHDLDGRNDLRNLTIYADTVAFRSEHHFYRTNVTIYARQLIFEDEGAIHTTPRRQIDKPFTERDSSGYPPNYKVADGRPGEPGGAVALHVGEIVLKSGGAQRKRIVTTGSNGQDGEDGGLKRYSPKGNRQPAANEGKDVSVVTLDDLKRKLGDLHHVASEFHYPSFPSNVVSASLVVWAPVGLGVVIDQLFIPGPGDLFGVKWKEPLKPDLSFWWSDLHGRRPGSGEDAYSSGTPGQGGAGGAVLVEYQGATPKDVDQLCDTVGGPNGKSIAVAGGRPGTRKYDTGQEPSSPESVCHALIFAVRHDADADSGWFKRRPYAQTIDVTNHAWGESKPAPVAAASVSGAKTIKPNSGATWLHARVLDSVVTYARDAFRAGYREDAQKALDPYRTALASASTLAFELAPKRTAVFAMLNNLQNNLDYYGNNVGWIPRLNVTTSFELFASEAKGAAQLLYFADTLATKWTKLKRTSDAARAASDALEAEIDFAHKAVIQANEDFAAAKDALTAIETDLKAAGAKFRIAHERAQLLAANHVGALKTVNSLCKLAGGLAKVIPVGQPYLGLAGDVVKELGDFEWTDADGKMTWDQVSGNFEGFGKTVGEKIDKFRKDHGKLLLKNQAEAGNESLEQKIKDAKGAIKILDDDSDKATKEIESDWIGARSGEIEALKKRIAEVEGQIQGATPATKPALEKRKLTLAEELKATANERLQAARVRLEKELATKQAELEEKDVKRKEALRVKVKELLDKKETAQKGIDGLKDKEKKRQDKAKDTFDAMNGVGDGVAAIGAGLGTLFAKVNPDDPKVKALIDHMETSELFDAELKKQYRECREAMDAINVRKTKAVVTLLKTQQAILQYTDAISTNLAALVALGRQRQSLDGVLGVDVQQYLHDMQDRARERVNAYLYDFIKAYQYHYLRDVEDTFYNFQKWSEKLRALDSVDAEGNITPPTLKQIQDIEDTVLRAEYLEMARKIVVERQDFAGQAKNSYTCTLSPEQREILLKTGCFPFSLLRDFNTNATLAMRDARIADITITRFAVQLAKGHENANLNVKIEHSGISVLLDSENNYWFFQKGDKGDPIFWRWIWKNNRLEKDELINKDKFLDEALAGKTVFREYMPGLLSDLTLWINQDVAPTKRTQDLAAITAVEFSVKFTYR